MNDQQSDRLIHRVEEAVKVLYEIRDLLQKQTQPQGPTTPSLAEQVKKGKKIF